MLAGGGNHQTSSYLMFSRARPPVRGTNARCFKVEHAGECANLNFNRPATASHLHRYSFWYPHLRTSPTVQQPVCRQVSYRLWQTRCVPECARASEQVERC
jgi:hypothetical protein